MVLISPIQRWLVAHGWIWRPQVSDEKREMIKTIFNENTRMSLGNAFSKIDLHFTKIWNFLNENIGFRHTGYNGINKSML